MANSRIGQMVQVDSLIGLLDGAWGTVVAEWTNEQGDWVKVVISGDENVQDGTEVSLNVSQVEEW